VLADREAAADDRADRRAARLAELERRIGVARDDHARDGALVRRVVRDDRAELLEELLQPRRERVVVEQVDRAVEHVAQAPRFVDLASAGARATAAGIDAENAAGMSGEGRGTSAHR